MIPTWSQKRSANSITCVEKKMVVPRRSTISRSTALIALVEIGSMLSNGSSRKRMSGAWMRAQASAVFFAMPCE